MTRICLHVQLVAFALLGVACGPPKLAGDADAEDESSDDAPTSSSSSSSETSSNETSTTETGTTETGTTETTRGFVPPDDVWATDPCDSFMQDCPDGEKCVPYASSGGFWDDLKCVPVTGDQAAGEPCTYAGVIESTDDCDATSFCWAVNPEGVGTCHPFCEGTPDTPECPEGSFCTISGDGVITICISTCDPVLQDCGEGLACFWANNGFSCIFTTQDIPPGDPCGFVNDCVEGSVCIAEDFFPSCDGASCCSPFCQLGGGDQECAVLPGTTCVPFFEQDMAPPGYEHVGVCILPP